MKKIRLPRAVSQSRLTTFLECRQKQKLREDGWRKPDVAAPLQFGILGHRCMENVEQEIEGPKKQEEVEAIVRRTLKEYEDWHSGRWNDKATQLFELHALQLEVLIPEYYYYWPCEREEVEMESEFTVSDFKPIPLYGIADGLILRNKKVRLVERKFRSRIDEWTMSETLTRDFQIMFEANAFRLLGNEIVGCTYEVNRRPGLKWKKTETADQYRERLREHIRADQESYFCRFEVPFDKEDMEIFNRDLQGIVQEYHDWILAGRPVRMFGNPCEGKYGLCEYVPICFYDDYSNHVQEKKGATRW